MEGEREKLLRLDEILHERVIGQDEAVQLVADAIIRARSGIKDPRRPIGSFIFLGPTGVGKTELAKALAAALFDTEDNMIRLDMSEYQERHTVSRLVGRTARIRGLRGRWSAHRGGAAQALLGRALRRAREGTCRRVQRAAPDPRRWPHDRCPGTHGRLPQHRGHHDVEPRFPLPARGRDRARRDQAGRAGARDDASSGCTYDPSSSTASTTSCCSRH